MRVAAVITILAAAAAAGCFATPKTAAPPTITQTYTQTVGDVHDPLAKRAYPPPLLLHSPAGLERATHGSSCVDYVDPTSGEGAGVCADTPYPEPSTLAIVRPGEHVRIDVRGAEDLVVQVHPLDCRRRTLRRLKLPADGRWRLDLRPGLYTLIVHVKHFELGARSGDTSGGLGLWVSEHHPRGIVPAASVYARGC